MKNNFTTIFLNPRFLEKWIKQNKAVYSGDFVPGVLQDNFILECKRGYAIIYENYINEWSSNYRIEFEPFPGDHVWTRWYNFRDNYIKEYGEIE